MRTTTPSPAPLLVLQWGRHNAGPLLLREYTASLAELLDGSVHVSGNRSVEDAVRPRADLPHFDVDTYSSAAGVVLGLPRLLVQAMRLRRYIRRHRIRTVFSPMFSLWQTLSLRVWLPRGVRYVSSIHDAIDHPGERHPVRDICRGIERRRADVIVAYSDAVRSALLRAGSAGTSVVRLELGAPPASAPRTGVGAVPVIGFFGRLVPYKGLEFFARAVAEIAEERPVRGVVYGEGGRPKSVPGAEDSALEWHLGYVGEDQVQEVLGTFDVLVLPYQEASQSGVVLQAFAAGLPVVVTPVGALPAQVRGRGGVVAAGQDAASIAAAIRAVLDDAQAYAELSSLAVRTAQASTWLAVTQPLVALIEKEHA